MKKPSKPRKRRLCKFLSAGENMIIYRDGTWRWELVDDRLDFDGRWSLAHSEFGPIFLYTDGSTDKGFRTEWTSDDEDEKRLGETVAKALADLEVEKMLSGKS